MHQRLCEQKTLLLLDGMEPLQSGYDFERGVIKDPALAMLVTELAGDERIESEVQEVIASD